MFSRKEKDLLELFLREYKINEKVAYSSISKNPYVIDLPGTPSEEIADAVFKLDYGLIKGKTFAANPKKFKEDIISFKNFFKTAISRLDDVISEQELLGKSTFYKIVDIPYLTEEKYDVLKGLLENKFPKYKFKYRESISCFSNNSIVISNF